MARPAGLEPATPGLEGPLSEDYRKQATFWRSEKFEWVVT